MRAALTAAIAIGAALEALAVPARAYQEEGQERIDYTAYTLRPWEVLLGPFQAAAGVPGGLMFGTYIPTWAAGPVFGAPIPTAFVKLRDPFDAVIAASARVTLAYVKATTLAEQVTQNKESTADLLVLPLEGALSARYGRQVSQSLLFTYVLVSAGGTDGANANIRGAAGVSNLSISSLLEVRLTRVVALSLLARVLAYQGNARVTAHFSEGSTVVDAELGARPKNQRFTGCAIPGVALSWEHVNLQAGVSYCNWWLPIVELPLPNAQVVPDFDFYVRF